MIAVLALAVIGAVSLLAGVLAWLWHTRQMPSRLAEETLSHPRDSTYVIAGRIRAVRVKYGWGNRADHLVSRLLQQAARDAREGLRP